jgi:hypothetical protein
MNYEIEEIKKSINHIGNSCHFGHLRIKISGDIIFNSLSFDDKTSVKDAALKTFFEYFPAPNYQNLKTDEAKDMLFEFLLTKENDVLNKLYSIL